MKMAFWERKEKVSSGKRSTLGKRKRSKNKASSAGKRAAKKTAVKPKKKAKPGAKPKAKAKAKLKAKPKPSRKAKRPSTPSFYKVIDHTADLRVAVKGEGLPQLFINSARALYDVMVEGVTGAQHRVITIDIQADDLPQLLVKWLSELLYQFDVHDFVVTQFNIKKLNEDHLVAECRGERFYNTYHKMKTEVKAITYHKLKISKRLDRYTAKIIFDI